MQNQQSSSEVRPTFGEHRRMILSPKWWDLPTRLPVKRLERRVPDERVRPNDQHQTAVLIRPARSTGEPNTTGLIPEYARLELLVDVTIFRPPEGDIVRKYYKNVDAMLADGWIVD